jgi:hypothetical protein
MPQTSLPTPPGFAELPKIEQVRYLQALWDQISENPDEIPVPESHLRLAEERLRRYARIPQARNLRLTSSTGCRKSVSETISV